MNPEKPKPPAATEGEAEAVNRQVQGIVVQLPDAGKTDFPPRTITRSTYRGSAVMGTVHWSDTVPADPPPKPKPEDLEEFIDRNGKVERALPKEKWRQLYFWPEANRRPS
jgi:hypothetical protein